MYAQRAKRQQKLGGGIAAEVSIKPSNLSLRRRGNLFAFVGKPYLLLLRDSIHILSGYDKKHAGARYWSLISAIGLPQLISMKKPRRRKSSGRDFLGVKV